MSLEEPGEAALRGFGNVEQIEDQGVKTSKRSHPLVLALKCFLILVFLAGVFVRVFSSELHATRIGDMLMAIGALGRLFLYARYSNSPKFIAHQQIALPLKLSEPSQPSVYDHRKRTPLERVIFDK